MSTTGSVSLVGLGPCSRADLTQRAIEAIAAASVLIVAETAPPEIQSLFSPDARVVVLGEESDPEALQRLVAREARSGERVAHLFPGDPFFDHDAAVEFLHCRTVGIPVEVVHGLSHLATASGRCGLLAFPPPLAGSLAVFHLAVPHAGGITPTPVPNESTPTPRKPGVTVRRRKKSGPEAETLTERQHALRAAALAAIPGPTSLPEARLLEADTLVFLRVANHAVLRAVANHLRSGSLPPSTPVALVTPGLGGRNDVHTSTLERIDQDFASHAAAPHAYLVVGDGVMMREHFEPPSRPSLEGFRARVLAAEGKPPAWGRLLEDQGAHLSVSAVVAEQPGEEIGSRMRAFRKDIAAARVLVFEDASSVGHFVEALRGSGTDVRFLPADATLVARDKNTQLALESFGLRSILVPSSEFPVWLADLLAGERLAPESMVVVGRSPMDFPEAGIIRDRIGTPIQLPVYTTKLPPDRADKLLRDVAAPDCEVILVDGFGVLASLKASSRWKKIAEAFESMVVLVVEGQEKEFAGEDSGSLPVIPVHPDKLADRLLEGFEVP